MNISTVFKKEDKKKCFNYRGIYVNNSLMKVLGKIMRNRLKRDFKDMEEECGFSIGTSYIYKYRDNGKLTGLVFIDLKKACDSVPQNCYGQHSSTP